MTKSRYFFPVLACLFIAACSQEQKARAVAKEPVLPVRVDTVATEEGQPVNTLGTTEPVPPTTPSTKTAPPAKHHVIGIISRQPHHSASSKRVAKASQTATIKAPTTFSDAPGTAAPPSESEQESFRQFLVSGLPPAQEFVIQTNHDTTLTGRQGTQVRVPAGAWKLPTGAGAVRLRLREFYSAADIFLAGLSTTSDGRLLETGGMLHLTATAAGQPVSLRPEATLRLRFPTKKAKPDMQLFRGVPTGNQINWQSDTTTFTQNFSINLLAFDTVISRMRGTYWPTYKPGERQQRVELKKITYPQSIIANVLRSSPSAQEVAMVYAYNDYVVKKLGAIKRMAEVEFTVDTTGAVTKARVRPGYNVELGTPVLEVVKSWRQWTPAVRSSVFGAMPTATVGVVRVLVTATGKAVVNPVTWDYDATSEVRKQAGMYDAEDLNQELSTAGIGWINCDRFIGSSEPLMAFELTSPGLLTRMMLFFENSRTILNGTEDVTGQKISFGRVPVGTKATVVAMRWKQRQAYLAMYPTTLSEQLQDKAFNFRPVTMQEIRQALVSLK